MRICLRTAVIRVCNIGLSHDGERELRPKYFIVLVLSLVPGWEVVLLVVPAIADWRIEPGELIINYFPGLRLEQTITIDAKIMSVPTTPATM